MSYNGSGTFLINTAGQPVVSGTVISSTAFNALTADLATGLSTAITKDGQTTITANIPMANYKFTGLGTGSAAGDSANLSQVQSTAVKLLASVSGADTITAVGSPNVAAYVAGQMFYFVAAGANTGAVTINIDSLGAKSITRDGTTALAAGDIQSGEVCVIVYDGTQFQLVNGASQSASIVTENLTVNKATVLNESGGDNDTRIEGDTDANLFFVDASTDRIGIGTNTPVSKLHVNDTAIAIQGSSFPALKFLDGSGNTDSEIYFGAGGGNDLNIVNYVSGPIIFQTNSTDRGRIDSAGNFGLGVTPSAAPAGSLFVKRSISGTDTSPFSLYHNATLNSGETADVYINNGAASRYYQNAGAHYWQVAASGTAGNNITFTQAMTLDASGNLGVGTTSPVQKLDIKAGDGNQLRLNNAAQQYTQLTFANNDTTRALVAFDETNDLFELQAQSGCSIRFNTNGGNERARITSGGIFLVGKSSSDILTAGVELQAGGDIYATAPGALFYANRTGTDGTLIDFRRDNTTQGTISVSGNTVSYNAFAGSHWSQLQDGSKPDILRGTVMESINELCEWPGEENERLPKAKISDTAGSRKVYGVFMAWDNDWTETNDMYVTAVGAFICRVNGSVTVQEGDLLESNGDGTARVQADDIIRSSTIGKVTSTVKTHEYDDGSYCVPTVLYCG